MPAFKEYQEARSYAQEQANAQGRTFGIEYNEMFKEWSVKGLPKAENRYGHELRMEAVNPDDRPDLAADEPGYQPIVW